ncbi:hypothetical protein [Arthrobacter sp. ZGTC131]|uniref:hypothetical protein n=1 Tax=Arthrobacter sp. ZGTC131 TaxID=2058898 RepID=UPI0021576C08|nr:hypothetical protein [Arthrobacter sp. ZGTC131]
MRGTDTQHSSDLLCVDVLGTRFAVRWGRGVTQEQQQRMGAAWARCAGDGAPLIPPIPMEPTESLPFSASVAYLSQADDGGTLNLQAASFEALAENLTSRLTLAAILENAGRLTMLHACGVASRETGRVVALVAKSGTGKTTAASVLARTYGYVSDETVAIKPGGWVVPYPKPLSVKQGPGAPKRQVGPDELGLQQAPPNVFIQSIVLLNRVDRQPGSDGQDRPGAAVLHRLPLADGLLALVPELSSQAAMDQPLQSLCRLIDRVGGIWQVTYSEAADLPQALEPLFRERCPQKAEWDAPEVEVPSAGVPDGWMRRITPRDAVTVDGDLLVMLETEIVRLSGIGPAIWDAATAAVPLELMAEEVGRVHGRHEGYRADVAAAAGQLIAKSVLEQGGE